MSSCPAIAVAESPASISGSLPARQLRVRELTKRFALAMHRGGGRAWLLVKQIGLGVLSSVWMLLACKSVIGLVSAFDTYLTIKYAVSLDVYEQNPLGRWLMGLDQGPVAETQQIAAFITAKFVGTLLVMIAIQGLAYWRVRVAGLVAMPVAVAQLYLVVHLIYGDG